MKGRRLSEEELRQREKEARSRQRIQDQAYREAQRGVYARIFQEQDAMPEDYREAFREDPRDRLYDRPSRDYGEDPRDRRWEEETFPWRLDRDQPRQEPRDRWEEAPRDRWEEENRERRRPPRETGPADYPDRGRRAPPSHPPGRSGGGKSPRRRRRRVVLIVLLVIAALLLAALAVHAVLVRPPELPAPEEQSEGVHPQLLEAGRREDVYTFLLVGRDDAGGGNTDTIMVGCYDVKNGTLDVLSIYRDTLVDVPWEIKKINSVYNQQGMEGLQTQIKNLIGYTPDYYFVMEMDMVAELVDALGGVDYEVPYNMDYDDPTQDLHIHFQQGMQHLNGEDAVKLLRWRKNNSGESLSVGDIGRVEIQHSFLKAMMSQAISLSTLTNIKEIAGIVDENLNSNLSYGEMIWFGEHVLMMEKDNIQFHGLPGDYTGSLWSSTYQNYQSYVFVNDSALRDIINGHMNPYTTEITADMQHIIHATTVNNMPGGADSAEAIPAE